LNTDGSLDESFINGFGFTPAGYNWGPLTRDIKLDSVGNIYVAGSFTDYNHAARFQYAKLDTNGALQEWSVLPAFKQMGINDGMDDMYDGANFLNTNLTLPYLYIKCYGGNNVVSGGEGACGCPEAGVICGLNANSSIPSTHTQAWDQGPEDDFYDESRGSDETGSDDIEWPEHRYLPVCDSRVMVGDGYFGEGSSYFTAMFPGMFVLAANNINITQFSITGNIGSDGDGADISEIFPINAGGNTYTAYLKTNYGAGDPSINHIIIVDGNGDGIEQFYDPTSEGDEHCITGLEGKTKLFFLCVGKADAVAMTTEEAKVIADKFLEVIGLNDCSTATYELDLSPDNPETIPNYKYYGEGNMDTAIIVDPVTGKRRSIQRTGYFEIVDSCGNRKVVSNKDGESFGEVPKTWADALGSIIKAAPEVKDIRILINNNYVDYVENVQNSWSEANNLMAFMDSVSISYTTFTDVSESSFSSLSEGFLLIPEIEEDDLNPDLTSGARSAIASFVANGGTLIMFHPSNGDVPEVLNAVFGFSLDSNGADEPINLTQGGAMLFPEASSTLDGLSSTSSINTSTLPQDAVVIYQGDGENQSVVTMIPYGFGKIYVLGWDWYNALPIGEEDGGWNPLLESILKS
jgi:hypothetical protein